MGDVDYVRDASVIWLNDKLTVLECETVDQLSLTKCKAPYKETLAEWIDDALHFVSEQNDLIKKLRDDAGTLKTELIASQQKVIGLQEDLLDSKTAQLSVLQSTVKDTMKAELSSHSSSVQQAVQSQIRSSWSEIAAKGDSQNITSEAKLKEVVKSAVAEEDKSKNIMIFGKEEVPDEDISATVDEVMHELNEKPRVIECVRVGLFEQGKSRPIKVRLTSFDTVANVLRNAKHLKNSSNNKATFIGPDRSKEERTEHKKLVDRMKSMMDDQPDKYHFIRRGVIRSVMKK
jgi:hypothetical protein